MAHAQTFVEGITAILVKNLVIPAKEAEELKRLFHDSSQVTFDTFLLEEGLVAKEDLLAALSQYYHVPSFDAAGYLFTNSLVTEFPKDFLLRNAVIPIMIDQNMLIVVADQPDRQGLEEAVRQFCSYDVNFLVGIRPHIIDAVEEFYDKALTEENDDEDLRFERELEHDADDMLHDFDKDED